MDEQSSEEYRQLRKMPVFSMYMKGARAMLRRIEEEFGDVLYKNKKEAPYIRAQIAAIHDPKNTENFLLHNYDRVCYRNHVRDKKGRLQSCEAYFTKYQEYMKEVHEGDGI